MCRDPSSEDCRICRFTPRKRSWVGRDRLVVLGGLFLAQATAFSTQPHTYKLPRSRARVDCRHVVYSRRGEEHHFSDVGSTTPSYTRRRTVGSLLAGTAALSTATLTSSVAHAGRPEIDASGELFSPKPEMLSGGTQAARGVPLRNSGRDELRAGQVLQTVYETRFIAYLSRFLLTFDPSAHAWWMEQGFGETWDVERKDVDSAAAEQKFAEFAESVEVGLADYFVGPYGSYSSLSAAKAGILAAEPAKSVRVDDTSRDGFLKTLFFGKEKIASDKDNDESVRLAKQGVLNLFTLLKARYNSLPAKRQLAILFSFISSPRLQPTNEIRGLLGETDNATITEVTLIKSKAPRNEADSRTSPRRGGGYGLHDFPTVSIDGPPALGDEYQPAKIEPVMKPTSRILRIRVIDGGEGYTAAPQVTVSQAGFYRPCQCAAILDRHGHVESVIVLDPGFGYGDRQGNPPKVSIDPPKVRKSLLVKEGKPPRRAKAVADLEYEISSIYVIQGGNGYVKTEPPKIDITPPQSDPDWFLLPQELPALRMEPITQPTEVFGAAVSEMRFSDGNIAFSTSGKPPSSISLDDGLRNRLERDPLELLPSSIRPVLLRERITGKEAYVIPSIARIPQFVAVLSPRFRAQDPLFGGVGKVPVTKGASSLKTSEYARLALSGAVCTVVVRTALNPLELVKTKQQLLNDVELLEFARKQICEKRENEDKAPEDSLPMNDVSPINPSTDSQSKDLPTDQAVAVLERTETSVIAASDKVDKVSEKIGTVEMIQSMIALRGPKSLFQSADITFLASLVFGSFGFGATELFRRSFSSFFFNEGADQVNEITVLMAAALATVITAAAASPFEVLRVRSMALLDEKPWTEVLKEFLVRYKLQH